MSQSHRYFEGNFNNPFTREIWAVKYDSKSQSHHYCEGNFNKLAVEHAKFTFADESQSHRYCEGNYK